MSSKFIDLLLFGTNGSLIKEIYSVLLYTIIILVLLFSFVVGTGQTFGQRCSKEFSNTVDIQECIERLNHGNVK